jgi:WD40 repeat protein
MELPVFLLRVIWYLSFIFMRLWLVAQASNQEIDPITITPLFTFVPEKTGDTRGLFPSQFSADGRFVLVYDHAAMTLWDVQTGERLRDYAGSFQSAALSPDGQLIVTTSDQAKTALVWDVATGDILRTLEAHRKPLNKAIFSPDGRTIVTISQDKTAITWDASTGRRRNSITGHEGSINQVVFSPNSELLLTASEDKNARLWSARTGRTLFNLKGHDSVHALGFSPDSQTVVTTGTIIVKKVESLAVILWDALTGQRKYTLSEHIGQADQVAFSPNSYLLLTGGVDGSAILWNTATGRNLHTFRDHTDRISGVAFSRDGQSIITSSYDSTTLIWDAQTYEIRHRLKASSSKVIGLAMSPDGQSLLTTYEDGTVSLWRMPARE